MQSCVQVVVDANLTDDDVDAYHGVEELLQELPNDLLNVVSDVAKQLLKMNMLMLDMNY